VTAQPLSETTTIPAKTEYVVDVFSGEVLDLAGVSDADAIDMLDVVTQKMDRYREAFNAMRTGIMSVLEARMRERGAKAIPHPDYECALEDEFGPPVVDLEALRAAQAMLPEAEAAKILVHVPEFVPPPVPAHDEPGKSVSITALKKRYAGTEVAALLEQGFHRPYLGSRFKFKRRATAPKPVEQIASEA
jgi:hypothetical protein